MVGIFRASPPIQRRSIPGRNVDDSDADLYAEYHEQRPVYADKKPPPSNTNKRPISYPNAASDSRKQTGQRSYQQHSRHRSMDLNDLVPDLTSAIETDFVNMYKAGNHIQTTHSMSPSVPSGVQDVPPSVQNVPPSMQNVPPSVQNVPPSVQNVPTGVQNVPSGVQNVPPGVQNVPCNVHGVPSSIVSVQNELPGVPSVLQNVPANVQSSMLYGTQSVEGNIPVNAQSVSMSHQRLPYNQVTTATQMANISPPMLHNQQRLPYNQVTMATQMSNVMPPVSTDQQRLPYNQVTMATQMSTVMRPVLPDQQRLPYNHVTTTAPVCNVSPHVSHNQSQPIRFPHSQSTDDLARPNMSLSSSPQTDTPVPSGGGVYGHRRHKSYGYDFSRFDAFYEEHNQMLTEKEEYMRKRQKRLASQERSLNNGVDRSPNGEETACLGGSGDQENEQEARNRSSSQGKGTSQNVIYIFSEISARVNSVI